MYKVQLLKFIASGMGLLAFDQVHRLKELLVAPGGVGGLCALGVANAVSQVLWLVALGKLGAVACSFMGLARKALLKAAGVVVTLLIFPPSSWSSPFVSPQGVGLLLFLVTVILFCVHNRRGQR